MKKTFSLPNFFRGTQVLFESWNAHCCGVWSIQLSKVLIKAQNETSYPLLSQEHTAVTASQQIRWPHTELWASLSLPAGKRDAGPSFFFELGTELVFGKWKPLNLVICPSFKSCPECSLRPCLCQQTHVGPVEVRFRGQQAFLYPGHGNGSLLRLTSLCPSDNGMRHCFRVSSARTTSCVSQAQWVWS